MPEIAEKTIKAIMEMLSDGEPIPNIAKHLCVPEDYIHENISKWESKFPTRFTKDQKRMLYSQHERNNYINKAMVSLESEGVEGFIREISPEMIKNVAQLALNGGDEKVRLTASKEILYMGGHKPKEHIDVYNHVDGMTKEQLVAWVAADIGSDSIDVDYEDLEMLSDGTEE